MLHQCGQSWFNSALRMQSGETMNSSHGRYRMLGKHLQERSEREQTFPISEAAAAAAIVAFTRSYQERFPSFGVFPALF